MTESLRAARPGATPSTIDYVAFAQSPRFLELKRRRNRFVIPLAVFFLVWYFGFVLVAAYAPAVMAIQVVGSVNLGLVLGLGQFVTTFAITMWYVSFSNKTLDPMGAALRAELEKMEQK